MDTQAYAEFAEREIKHICTNYKKRRAASNTEREATEYLQNQIETNKWADNTEMQKFRVQPHSFMMFTKAVPPIMATGGALFFISPWITFGCTLLSLFLWITSQILYWRLLDFFLPQKISQNLSAVRESKGETKRRIIIGGHIDAAFEWKKVTVTVLSKAKHVLTPYLT